MREKECHERAFRFEENRTKMCGISQGIDAAAVHCDSFSTLKKIWEFSRKPVLLDNNQ